MSRQIEHHILNMEYSPMNPHYTIHEYLWYFIREVDEHSI